jgi:hypothetical protein
MESSHVPQPSLSASPPSPLEIWIVKGIVTDPSAYDRIDERLQSRPKAGEQRFQPRPKVGDPEFRVFDSDPDSTAGCLSSSDFLDLETILRTYPDATVHFVQEEPPEVELYNRWERFVQVGSLFDRVEEIRIAAYEQGVLGPLLDALEERRASEADGVCRTDPRR